MKLWEVTTNEDGSVKLETELTPDEVKGMLQLAVMTCIQQGIMVKSLIGHFQITEDDNEVNEDKEVSGEDVPTISWEEALDMKQ